MKTILPLLLGLVLTACENAPPPPVNVLLVTLDTVRADRLGCYGYEGNTTPFIDQLAEQGVVFTQAFSPVPLTLPSHTTILTGAHPLAHGVHNNGNFVLDARARTLAEDLKEAGYATGAVMGAVVLDAQYGLAQGFDFYEDTIRSTASAEVPERKAEEVTRLGLAWLEQTRSEPFFLWLHYYDPHDEYDPPSPFKERFPGEPYDGEIAYTDHCLKQVVDRLKTLGLFDRTLIVIVGDHGEGLGEHNESAHGIFIYDTTMKVPLILHHPSLVNNGLRNDSLVDTLDIRPTVLELAGLAENPGIQGQSLMPLLREKPTDRRPILLESLLPQLNFGWSPLEGVRTRDWKYIHAPRPELFAIAEDQGERQDLSRSKPKQLAAMQELYWRTREEMESKQGEVLAREQEMSPEEEERLKELGYVWSKESHRGQEGKDPKDMIQLQATIAKAEICLAANQLDQGVMLIESVLAEDPENFLALLIMGKLYHRLNDRGLATAYLDKAASINPHSLPLLITYGTLLRDYKDFEGARAQFEKIRFVNPHSPVPDYEIANMLMLQGKLGKAAEHFRKVIALDPQFSDARVNLAQIHLNQRRSKKAEEELRRVLESAPDHLIALLMLGDLQFRRGEVDEAVSLGERAREAAPSDPAVYENLEKWYRKAGRQDEAQEAAETRSRLAP